jgi:hypothetical protein
MAGWRDGTNKGNNARWARWEKWCLQHDINPADPLAEHLANYAADVYKTGVIGATVAANVGAVATTLRLFDNFAADDPVIRRLLRGARLTKPSKPRYKSFWDPELVRRHLLTLGQNDCMGLACLRDKCSALMRLALLGRSADLAAIDVTKLVRTPTGYDVSFGCLKNTPVGESPDPVFLPCFPDDPLACPVAALDAYLRRTTNLRRRSADGGILQEWRGVFLALTGARKSLSVDSIARTFLTLMTAAGVDTAVWRAHSARGAAATALLKATVTPDEVMKAGRWRSELVFREFYNRAVRPVNVVSTLFRARPPVAPAPHAPRPQVVYAD